MNCERSVELLELTIGLTSPHADAGVTDSDAASLTGHLGDCVACSGAAAGIRAAADRVSLALRSGDAGDDEALVRAVLDRLPARRRRLVAWPLRWPAAAAAAAVLFVGVLSWSGWFHGGSHQRPSGPALAPYALAPPAYDDYAGPRFVDVTARSGIIKLDHTGSEGSKDWMVEVVGHGAAVLDMDGDGDLDLFVPDGNRVRPEERVANTWRLYRNDGEMRFTDVTAGSGLESSAWGGGAVAGDVDADGRPDLFVPCYGYNRLFLNRGEGRFEDVSKRSGIRGLHDEWSTAAALGDVDGDGDLDLYVSNYADMRRFMAEVGVGRSCTWRNMPVPCGPEPLKPQQDRLFLNAGDGTFVDATDDRMPRAGRYSFQPVIYDADGDADLDVFVAADDHPNLLFLNDGTGRFTEYAMGAGVATGGEGHDQACMGVAVGDFDGDGRSDVLVTNFSHDFNALYRARPAAPDAPSFSDAAQGSLMGQPSYLTLGWGATFLDVDCDGDLDAATANGHLYPDVESTLAGTTYEQHVSLFENDGAGRFRDVAASAGEALLTPRVHRGLVRADFDDDGHTDLFATVLNGPAVLLRNDGRGAGGSVRLLLRRRDGRTEAAGARVRASVTTEGGTSATQVRDLVIGSSFGCSEDPRVVIATGGAGAVERVEVQWPYGDAESFGRLAAGGVYELVEGTGRARRVR